MGFRTRLLLGLALAVVLAAGVQAALGYSLYKSWLDNSAAEYVERYLATLSEGVDTSGATPSFDETRLLNPPQDWSWIRYRLAAGDTVYFQGPEDAAFPVNNTHWTKGVRQMNDGYRFELALNLEDIRQSLPGYTRTTLLTLTLTLAVALGFVALLFRFSVQPIRRLTEATQALTRQRFPEPVPVPPGNDEVARLARSFNHMAEEIKAFLERERSFTRSLCVARTAHPAEYLTSAGRSPRAGPSQRCNRHSHAQGDPQADGAHLERPSDPGAGGCDELGAARA